MAAKRNTKSKARQAEAVIDDEDVKSGGGLTLEDGMQIFTFLALIGAVLIVHMTLLPVYEAAS
jgi:hypothetical protein